MLVEAVEVTEGPMEALVGVEAVFELRVAEAPRAAEGVLAPAEEVLARAEVVPALAEGVPAPSEEMELAENQLVVE